jgi:hypothetical protein
MKKNHSFCGICRTGEHEASPALVLFPLLCGTCAILSDLWEEEGVITLSKTPALMGLSHFHMHKHMGKREEHDQAQAKWGTENACEGATEC